MHQPPASGLGRHHRGRGLGRFGKGFVDGEGPAGRPLGLGRKLAGIDLQLLMLGLLEEKPRHGYEIIKVLSDRSQGFYVPSPGMVYPALAYLAQIRQATVQSQGARKLHHIAPEGLAYLAMHRARADALFAQFGRVADRMGRVRRALQPEQPGDEADEDTIPATCGSTPLGRAREELTLAILGKTHSPFEEQERITAILEHATAQVLRK